MFSVVSNDTQNLVLILTKETLGRIWPRAQDPLPIERSRPGAEGATSGKQIIGCLWLFSGTLEWQPRCAGEIACAVERKAGVVPLLFCASCPVLSLSLCCRRERSVQGCRICNWSGLVPSFGQRDFNRPAFDGRQSTAALRWDPIALFRGPGEHCARRLR